MTGGNGRKPGRRLPLHPYRDAAIAYAILGVVVVIVAIATGSSVLRGVIGGIAAFVLATGWTWWRLRKREEGAPR